MVTRPSGSLGGMLYDGFEMLQRGLGTASTAVGIDPGEFMEQFHVPIAFSLVRLGAGSMVRDQIGIGPRDRPQAARGDDDEPGEPAGRAPADDSLGCMRESTIVVPGSSGMQATLHHADQPRALLLLVHGFGEHSRRHRRTVRFLLDRGVSVVTYDLRGH